MRLLHRHRWAWHAQHWDRVSLWDIEACVCGAKRKGYWVRQFVRDEGLMFTPNAPVMWTSPIAWFPV